MVSALRNKKPSSWLPGSRVARYRWARSTIRPKTFEQAAGFLRIRDGENPLGGTTVHPESYPAMAGKLGVSVRAYTFKDIVEELRKPGRDPRDQFVAPSFRGDVKELSDVQVGMKLEGAVTNVTKFGAFVDIGVHRDGLCAGSGGGGEGRPDREGADGSEAGSLGEAAADG